MKVPILTFVILLSFNQKVTCAPIFDYIVGKITDIADTVTNTFITIRAQVENMLLSTGTNKRPVLRLHYPTLTRIGDPNFKSNFNDFVEKAAAENETEIPEYINLKSEPTALMSTPQLATLHGRRVESHVIHTKDGYLLTLHRISPRKDRSADILAVNQTVILHHGLLGSSADWILLGPEKSLPYILTDAGYDVWMANARGNYYSRGHVKMAVDSDSFWRFSFQEMGEHDLSAVIDYIRNIKKSDDPIDYIGHSMGATALLVLLSTNPQYNQYLRVGILLAPLAFMSNVEGPFKVLTAMASSPPEQLLKLIGNKEFVPTRKIPKWLALKYCKGPLLFCCNPLYFISGGIPEDNHAWNLSFLARLLYHVPAGGSTDTIMHYAQLVKSGKFHRYNNVYEEFPLNQVTLPIALFSSSEDWLATIPDVLRLYFSIVNPIDHYIIRGRNMSHTEFVWGARADEIVFKKVLEFLDSGLAIIGNAKNSNECVYKHAKSETTHLRELRSSNGVFAPLNLFFGGITNYVSSRIEEKKKRMKTAFQAFFEVLGRGKTSQHQQQQHYHYVQKPVAVTKTVIHEPEYMKIVANSSDKRNGTFDTQAEFSAEHLIIAHGFKSESHTVLTVDGYMITMHRIMRDLDKRYDRAVILHHGILGSSEDWLLLGERRALPYLLSDGGYDVWLLNARGNKYSKTHTGKSSERLEFWDFSWHEMGVYDLPAAFKYISEITNKAELNFIGHSMGATALLVLLTTSPEYNDVLRSGVLLAPLAFMYHVKGPMRLLANFYSTNGYNSLNFLGQTEFMNSETFPEQIVKRYCKGDKKSCENPMLLLVNGGSPLLEPKLMEDVMNHTPSGTSAKTIIHFVQLAKSGFFQMFDYGAANNVRKYKNGTPEIYNLKKVTLPLALFSSPSDWLATVSDIKTILPLLPNVNVHHVVKADNFGHYDFVWSPDAPDLVFNFILPLLDKITDSKKDGFFE
ncbi:hypothetical protein SFRURICE_007710 [Spodoptera frugiperda]|nr:hypothetical protein SFRURICE_007710 [Spodoptera frugiperda]